MPTERNYEALHQLRRVVEAAPEDLFHMRAWVERADCGTARCAFGWCIVDPWFRENTDVYKIDLAFGLDVQQIGLHFDGKVDPAAVFGLDSKNADRLFANDYFFSMLDIGEHEISREEVLVNIDRLLAGEDAEEYHVFRS